MYIIQIFSLKKKKKKKSALHPPPNGQFKAVNIVKAKGATDIEALNGGDVLGGEELKRRKFRWRILAQRYYHKPNNLKLHTNKKNKKKTSNDKYEQSTLKLEKSQMTKGGGGWQVKLMNKKKAQINSVGKVRWKILQNQHHHHHHYHHHHHHHHHPTATPPYLNNGLCLSVIGCEEKFRTVLH